MSDVRATAPGSVYDRPAADREGSPAPVRRAGLPAGWVIAGVAALALGAWAAYHFGADFRRYVKMERM